MTSRSNVLKSRRSDRSDYGFARVRDKAFDAVLDLWRRRQSEGQKLTDLASVLHRDIAAVCRNLSGPGNWTLRTFGELVEAMDGEVEISVHALGDPLPTRSNYDAYCEYEAPTKLSAPVPPPDTKPGTDTRNGMAILDEIKRTISAPVGV